MARKTTKSSTKKRSGSKKRSEKALGGDQVLITSPIVASSPPGKPPKKSKAELASMQASELDLVAATYIDGYQALAEQVQYTKERLAEMRAERSEEVGYPSHLKFLMDGMTVMVREIRQINKQRIEAASKVPPDQSDEYLVGYILEDLPPKRRERVLKALAEGAPEVRGLL